MHSLGQFHAKLSENIRRVFIIAAQFTKRTVQGPHQPDPFGRKLFLNASSLSVYGSRCR
ncbi:hypothetical protein OEB94_25880 [Streptomyces sp. ICN988]|uniref:hypothetical protein n=1 Tax=unclassified Streptomyces TaxID=2593676 RepID=UPI0021E3620B|nr:hypothetical protein [Streptomyces sp. ICN988]MCV2462704.1 hypothetical protein [Streptomyces sp. ICN988]